MWSVIPAVLAEVGKVSSYGLVILVTFLLVNYFNNKNIKTLKESYDKAMESVKESYQNSLEQSREMTKQSQEFIGTLMERIEDSISKHKKQ